MDSGRGPACLLCCCVLHAVKSFFVSTVLRTALQNISLQTGPERGFALNKPELSKKLIPT